MNKTPMLRFKEFSGDWEEKKLGKLGEFKKTYSFSRSVEGEGNYKHIHYGDIHMNYKGIISKDKYIPSIDIPSDDSYEFIKERDIIFADASEDRKDLGKVAVVRDIEGNVLSGLHTICFRPNESLNSEFFLNHSLNKEYLKFMYTRGNGAKVLGISKSNLSEYKFLAPSKEEQEKIASFFYLIDDKISLQVEKLELLKDYKCGMMQKIFSRELRFKDDEGRDYPEWEEKKLGDIIDKGKAGGTPKSTVKDYYNGDINFLSISDMTTQGKYINYTEKTITKLGLENSSAWLVPKNSLIYSMYASVGFVSINKIELATSQAMFSMIINENTNMDYVYHYLSYFKDNGIQAFIETGTQGNLNANTVKNIVIPYPNRDEQDKIALSISSLGNKIEKEEEKLESLKQYKKGLLQQMFV